MRKASLFAAGVALAFAGAACSGGDTGGAITSTPPAGGTVTISAAGSAIVWSPADASISAGDAVQWRWSGAADLGGHNVVFAGTGEKSGDPASDGEFTKTFDTAGAFDYYCAVHGTEDGGMAGTITVA